jgi:hypothetical protein
MKNRKRFATRLGVEMLEARMLLTGVPAFHSLPGATASIYLDFDGHFEPVWSSYTNVTTPAFTIDGDYTTFSIEELAEIESIWARVAEDYAPFNINVTTVEPAVLAPGMPIAAANGIALRVAIGGSSMDWQGGVGVTGISNVNSFTNANANVAYVFSNNATTSPLGDTVSHEAGHAFGLWHQAGEDPADGPWSSLMAGEETASIWVNGINTLGQPQDDMAVLADALNGFGYRSDDHGNTAGTATPLTFQGTGFSGSGLIGTNDDLDLWSFSIATASSYRIAVDPAAAGPNLDVVLELRDSGGTLVASASPTATLGAEIALNLIPGSYFLTVAKTALYGLVGTYTINVSAPPAGISVAPAETLTVKETGASAAFELVLDSQPMANVTIPLASSNPAEGSVSADNLIFTPDNWNVPQTVTVTGVADAVADGDTLFSIVVGSSASADAQYHGLDAPDLSAVNIDSSNTGFVVWADNRNGVIKRSHLDGSEVQALVDLQAVFGPGSYSPRGLDVDLAGGKIYWSDSSAGRIQRANLDGSMVETLASGFTGGGLRGGVAVDSAAGKVYWVDGTARKIQRANLDGTNVQDLVTGVTISGTRDIVLDVVAGKMYWPDLEENSIRRANLDGSNVEVLWTGVEYDGPIAIDLDIAAGKMYWADVARDKILRANLDGTATEVVIDMRTIANGSAITGLALDVRNGNVYWTDLQTYASYRANLDGSDVVLISSEAGIGVAIVAPAISVSPTIGLSTSESGGTSTFNVALTTPPSANVTVPIQSSNLQEGTVSASSVTFTPLNWNVPQTVTVIGVNDAIDDGNIAYSVILGAASSMDPDYQGIDPRDVSVTNLDNDDPPAKFFVVDDASANRTYKYQSTGASLGNYALNNGNSAPRGIASTAVGDKVWVVDANRKVYVYDINGNLLGSWTAGSMASNATPEGIATNGTDVWIVDSRSDKVFKYSGAASRLSGSQNAASSFNLNSGNRDSKDIVTDGASLWVVNDSTTNKVFKYSVGGSLVGSWTISSVNSQPTGITIDPTNVSDIWIVDNGTDRVYQYTGAATRTSGSQSAATSFALAAGNTNPQGIADPPPAGTLQHASRKASASWMAHAAATPTPAQDRAVRTKSASLVARERAFAAFDSRQYDVVDLRVAAKLDLASESGTAEFETDTSDEDDNSTSDGAFLDLDELLSAPGQK